MPRATSSAGPAAPAAAPTPVTPKGHATRAAILQAAAEVFAERGYANTTLSQLITRSGLTKGAFYFHFTSKEQLAFAVLEEKQRQWLEFVSQRALDKPRAIDQLRALGPALIRLHRQDPSAYSAPRLSRDLSRMPELADTVRVRTRGWIDLVAGIISQAQQDGDLPSGLDATALATILVAATDGLKDLSDILDPPHRARRGFEQRMQHFINIVEALISRDEHPATADHAQRHEQPMTTELPYPDFYAGPLIDVSWAAMAVARTAGACWHRSWSWHRSGRR